MTRAAGCTEHPLVKLLRWCRANVPDGRMSMCRVEPIGGVCQPCPHLCGDCASVEKRAKALEAAQTSSGT